MNALRYSAQPIVRLPGAITIALLGTFQLFVNHHPLPISRGSKAEGMLVHLALAQERRLWRDELLAQLWPDHNPTLASQSLHSLVYQLNKRMGQRTTPTNLVSYDNGYYALNPGTEVSIDIDYFESWQQEGKAALQVGRLEHGLACYEQALALYRGDLCSDSAITDVAVILERERLRVSLLDLLATLADYHLPQDPMRALAYIHRLLNHEPCREDAHRQAMRCYMRLGARAQALRQYQFCVQILAAEFGAQPEAATVALFEQIRLAPSNLQQN